MAVLQGKTLIILTINKLNKMKQERLGSDSTTHPFVQAFDGDSVGSVRGNLEVLVVPILDETDSTCSDIRVGMRREGPIGTGSW